MSETTRRLVPYYEHDAPHEAIVEIAAREPLLILAVTGDDPENAQLRLYFEPSVDEPDVVTVELYGRSSGMYVAPPSDFNLSPWRVTGDETDLATTAGDPFGILLAPTLVEGEFYLCNERTPENLRRSMGTVALLGEPISGRRRLQITMPAVRYPGLQPIVYAVLPRREDSQ